MESRNKELVEGTVISKLRYCIETVSASSKQQMNKMERLQSKAGRLVLDKERIDWSRTGGLRTLNWLSMSPIEAKPIIQSCLKIPRRKEPRIIYESLVVDTQEGGGVRVLKRKELEKMTILTRKSWQIRVLCWYFFLPGDIRGSDIERLGAKKILKSWVKDTIPRD